MKKNIVVTGGLGFIGSNFIRHIFEKKESKIQDNSRILNDFRIHNIDCETYASNRGNLESYDDHIDYGFSKVNITDVEAVRNIFSEFRPDIIVHFAAESHVDRSIESGEEFIKTNVLGTQVLLDMAREFSCELFFHVSTDEVYGSINHGFADEDSQLSPSSPYSASKAASDLLVLSHNHTYGTPVIITRCTNNFGPLQHHEKLIPKMITRSLSNKKLPLYGNGQQIRNWLYVRDHCEAILQLIEKGSIGEIYNIAGNEEITNLELTRSILKFSKKPESLIEFVTDRPGHDERYGVDDKKIRNLGWKPTKSLNDGLIEMINDYSKETKRLK
tara:strand:- start:860 stop:1849 length:990 start_codon:yes stop_codon:yes gene_type:complete